MKWICILVLVFFGVIISMGLYFSYNKALMTSKAEVKVSAAEQKPSPPKNLRTVKPVQTPNWWERSQGYVIPIGITVVVLIMIALFMWLRDDSKVKEKTRKERR